MISFKSFLNEDIINLDPPNLPWYKKYNPFRKKETYDTDKFKDWQDLSGKVPGFNNPMLKKELDLDSNSIRVVPRWSNPGNNDKIMERIGFEYKIKQIEDEMNKTYILYKRSNKSGRT